VYPLESLQREREKKGKRKEKEKKRIECYCTEVAFITLKIHKKVISLHKVASMWM